MGGNGEASDRTCDPGLLEEITETSTTTTAPAVLESTVLLDALVLLPEAMLPCLSALETVML